MNIAEATAKLNERFPGRLTAVGEMLWHRPDSGKNDSEYTITIFRKDWDATDVDHVLYQVRSTERLEDLVTRALGEFAIWESKALGRTCDNCGKKFFHVVDGNECQDMTCRPCEDMDMWEPRECDGCHWHKLSVCVNCEDKELWE